MSSDAVLARDLATGAGALLRGVRGTAGERGDRTAHDFLAHQLARHRPGDAVLSEEADDDLTRLDAERVWIVDPLDGTREFGEPGRADWAVHVALWVRGELTAAAVALPALGRTESTDAPPTPAARGGGPVRLAVSRSRPPEHVDRLAAALDAEVVPMGSAGAKAMAVARGEVDVYAHAGGQHEWD